jgi:hypothetical protein
MLKMYKMCCSVNKIGSTTCIEPQVRLCEFAGLHLFVLQHQLSFAVLTGNGFMLNTQ